MRRPPINNKHVDSTADLVAVIIERSIPDQHRPQCSPDREERLARVEKESAACYGRSELLAARLRRLAKLIDEKTEKDTDSTLDPGFDDDEDSVVVHIDALRAQAKID